MLAIFLANLVSLYIYIIHYITFTAWCAEILVARISSEIENFWPAPGLNPYLSDRKRVTISSLVVKYICMQYFGYDMHYIYMHAIRWLRYLMLPKTYVKLDFFNKKY